MSKNHRIIHARLPDATKTICGLKNKGPLVIGTYIPVDWRMCKRCDKDTYSVMLWIDDERKTVAVGGAMAEDLPVGVRQTGEIRARFVTEPEPDPAKKYQVRASSWSIVQLPDPGEEVA